MKNIICCLLLGSFYGVFAQVGVNTGIPLKALHIDGKGDNSSGATLTEAQIKNDVVIDEEGQLGIGTINPTAKLDVYGNAKLGGNVLVEGGLSLSNEIKINGRGSRYGEFLISKGNGNAPVWYLPPSAVTGDIHHAQDYSFTMLDEKSNPVSINVEELFNKYLDQLTIPAVVFYASSTESQPINKGFNTIDIFEPKLPKNKYVSWDATNKVIEITEAGAYLFAMQVGVNITQPELNDKDDDAARKKNVLTEMIIGLSSTAPIGSGGKWIGRATFRIPYSKAGSARSFVTYNTLLQLKKGDKIYPAFHSSFEAGKVTLQGLQRGDAGAGVVTHFSITKY